MIIKGIKCVEKTKEDILERIKQIPCLDGYYSEKYKIIVLLLIDAQKKTCDVLHILSENENGKFWENEAPDTHIKKLAEMFRKEMQ